MARGDYFEVTYRTGVGTETKRVQARGAGSTVAIDIPKMPNDPFIAVMELSKVGQPIRTARFAKTEVVAIDEGNGPVTAPKAAKK